MPSFLVQPLVENAVKHGVARSRGPVAVSIEARAEDGKLRIDVENGLPVEPDEGADRPRSGVGLKNVRRRLEALYGNAASLTAEARDNSYVATITLPLSSVRVDS